MQEEEPTSCRICHASCDTPVECACTGSVGFEHAECRREWQRMREGHRDGLCELCRKPGAPVERPNLTRHRQMTEVLTGVMYHPFPIQNNGVLDIPLPPPVRIEAGDLMFARIVPPQLIPALPVMFAEVKQIGNTIHIDAIPYPTRPLARVQEALEVIDRTFARFHRDHNNATLPVMFAEVKKIGDTIHIDAIPHADERWVVL